METLLPILRDYPHLVNLPSEPKGYTPLHQAAWHGANLSVIGELLSLGADRSATTNLSGRRLMTSWLKSTNDLIWSIFFSQKSDSRANHQKSCYH
jgi:ankyrin repeat protein